MTIHLANIDKLLAFVMKKTSAQKIIDILYEKVKFMVERHITMRDVESFIAYLKFQLPSSTNTGYLKFNQSLIQDFINHTYIGFPEHVHEVRNKKMFEYFKNNIRIGDEINNKNIEVLERILKEDTIPTIESLKNHALVALIFKWLQGPLQKQLSKDLKTHVIFLATIFGQYETKMLFDVKWETYKTSGKDLDLIVKEYDNFEIAIKDAITMIRNAQTKISNANPVHEQFYIVFECLYRLFKMSQINKLDDISTFKDKILVATTLICLQDEFVEKTPELKSLTLLFLTYYYKFRDLRSSAAKIHWR